MQTHNEIDLRVTVALADIMPTLSAYVATADALGLNDEQREALDAAVLRLYRAGYAAGKRVRPTDVTVLDAE